MPDRSSKLSAFLRLARLSNLPTCWSNVLVGSAAAAATTATPLTWWPIVATMAAVSLLYIAGMILNDIADLGHDREQDRERPIVRGDVSLREAWALMLACATIGLGMAALLGRLAFLLAAALVACIIAYDLLNKRIPRGGAVVFMGACRGLVYIFASAAVTESPPWRIVIPLAMLLALYTIIITLIARREAGLTMDTRKWLALAMPIIALAGATFIQPVNIRHAILMGLITTAYLAFAAWHVLRPSPRIIAAVLAYLAGISLVDAYFLALLDQPPLIAIAIGCFLLTRLLHRRIAGT